MKKALTSKDKATIALRALTESDTLSTIASSTGAHPVQVGLWKKKAKENLYTLFDKSDTETKTIATLQRQVNELHRIIGTRDEELAWLQKKTSS